MAIEILNSSTMPGSPNSKHKSQVKRDIQVLLCRFNLFAELFDKAVDNGLEAIQVTDSS